MKMVVAFLLAGMSAVIAPAAETRQERGKRVVDEALAALGGDAFLHMKDRVESGRAYSFYNGQLSGLSIAKMYTRYLEPRPGEFRMRERQAFGKDEADAIIFQEEGAWEVTWRGAEPLADQRIADRKDAALRNIFYILRMRLKEPGLEFYSQGSDRYENRQVEIVDITDSENKTVTVYFDQSSKLPVRQVYRKRNPEYKDFDTDVTVFAKYRDIGGGVKWPFDVRRDRNGLKLYEMYSETVEIDKGLSDNLFTLPAKIKMLPKAK
jgi:hypothetical protein